VVAKSSEHLQSKKWLQRLFIS